MLRETHQGNSRYRITPKDKLDPSAGKETSKGDTAEVFKIQRSSGRPNKDQTLTVLSSTRTSGRKRKLVRDR